MQSSSKKTRKRNLSPDSSSEVQGTPKRTRASASSKTPISSSGPSLRQTSIRKSVRKSTSNQTHVQATSDENVEDEAASIIPVPVIVPLPLPPSSPLVSPPRSRTSTSTRKAVSKSTTKKTPQRRRDPNPTPRAPPSLLLPRVTDSPTDMAVPPAGEEEEEHGTGVEAEGRGVSPCIVSPEEVTDNSNSGSGSGSSSSTPRLLIRLGQGLVLFTLLFVCVASLLRLDHDKHDTHGSISRSGRKMYRYQLIIYEYNV
jgi:hypothetical protein